MSEKTNYDLKCWAAELRDVLKRDVPDLPEEYDEFWEVVIHSMLLRVERAAMDRAKNGHRQDPRPPNCTPKPEEPDPIRGQRPSIEELYARWDKVAEKSDEELPEHFSRELATEAFGALSYLRPLAAQMGRSVDTVANDLFFQVLLAETGSLEAAQHEFGLRCRCGGSWEIPNTVRIKE